MQPPALQGVLFAHQKGLVELEGAGELPLQLVHAVQPLQEDGAALVQVVRLLAVAAAVGELVAEVQPLCLHQHLKALPTRGAETGRGGIKVCHITINAFNCFLIALHVL